MKVYTNIHSIPVLNYFMSQKYYTLHLQTSSQYLPNLAIAGNQVIKMINADAKKAEIVKYIMNVYAGQYNKHYNEDYIVSCFACLVENKDLNLYSFEDVKSFGLSLGLSVGEILEETKNIIKQIDQQVNDIAPDFSGVRKERTLSRRLLSMAQKLPSERDSEQVDGVFEDIEKFFIRNTKHINYFAELEQSLNEKEFGSEYDVMINRWFESFEISENDIKNMSISRFLTMYNSRKEQNTSNNAKAKKR